MCIRDSNLRGLEGDHGAPQEVDAAALLLPDLAPVGQLAPRPHGAPEEVVASDHAGGALHLVAGVLADSRHVAPVVAPPNPSRGCDGGPRSKGRPP
eukprot:14872106-Alexandrium_andersonii.AAC.1